MTKKKEIIKPPKELNNYLLVNHEKLDRVINGVIGPQGKLVGGLGKDADLSLVLAEYDRLGGLILTKGDVKLATGSFWDFENKEPRKEPLVELAEKANKTGNVQLNVEEVGDEVKPKSRKRKVVEEE